MPGSDGKLTDVDYKSIQAWMAKYNFGNHLCPICQSSQWSIGEYLVQPTSLGGPMGINFGLPGYPAVLLISGCGYTRMMNAVMMGLAPALKR